MFSLCLKLLLSLQVTKKSMWAFPDRRSLVFERFPVSAPRPDSVENEIILRPSSDIYVLSPTLSAHTLTSVREFPHFSVLHGVALTRAPHQETILQAKHGAVITCVPRDLSGEDAVAGSANTSAKTRIEGQKATMAGGVGQGMEGRKRRRHFWEPNSDFEQEMQEMWADRGGGRERAHGRKQHTTWRGLEKRLTADDDQVRHSIRLVGYS